MLLFNTTTNNMNPIAKNFDHYFEKYKNYLPTLTTDIIEQFNLFFYILLTEALPNGFIGSAQEETLWLRHILDSILVLQKKETIEQYLGATIIDIGTGAGLPGIPLSILYPKKKFFLVDSSTKKIDFLKQTAITLKIDNIIPQVREAGTKSNYIKVNTAVFRAFQKPLTSIESSLHWTQIGGAILYWRASKFFNLSSTATKEEEQHAKMVENRLRILGIDIIDHVSFNSPEELGNRGLYILKISRKASEDFPRTWKKMKIDTLNNTTI